MQYALKHGVPYKLPESKYISGIRAAEVSVQFIVEELGEVWIGSVVDSLVVGIGRSGRLYPGCRLFHMDKFLSAGGFDNLNWNLDHFWCDESI